jgi:putative MATE family efflux protein
MANRDLALAAPAPAGLGVVWSLAWPVIATLAVESVVGLVDMLMVGRLGATAVAAVGVGVHLLSAVSTVMFAVGTGILAIVARHVGAGERAEAAEVLAQSIVAAVLLAIGVVVPVIVWAPELVRALGVADTVASGAAAYLRRVMVGVPAEAVLFVIAFGLRGAGDTRTPLVIGGLVGAVHVVGDWVLIFGRGGLPALGVLGAAWAAALSYVVGTAAALALVMRRACVLPLTLRALRPRPGVVRRVLRVGYPAAAEHPVMQVGFLLYMVFAARYGTAAVAAYVIGVRILALSFLPGFGFAAAASTLVGQHLGAQRPDAAARGGWTSTRLAVGMMTAAGVAIFLLARPVAGLFTEDPQVVAATVSFIHVLAVAQPLMAIDFTLGGALRGAGDTRFPLVAALAGFYGCRLGMAALVSMALRLDLVWLWLALIGDYVVRAVLKGRRFRSGRWQQMVV